MSYAELSASKVAQAANEALKKYGDGIGANVDRVKALRALAGAVRHDQFANDRMQVSADDFALLASNWEPPINV